MPRIDADSDFYKEHYWGWQFINLDTDEVIRNCVWGDTDTGDYETLRLHPVSGLAQIYRPPNHKVSCHIQTDRGNVRLGFVPLSDSRIPQSLREKVLKLEP